MRPVAFSAESRSLGLVLLRQQMARKHSKIVGFWLRPAAIPIFGARLICRVFPQWFLVKALKSHSK
jgi:hypothetical protein